jgi:two-component system chemotaxis sensor kinase CheA
VPLLRQAGHDVMLGLPVDGVVDPADVVLCTDPNAAQAAEMIGCRVVHLRASPRPAGPQEDGSIYRYDQAALMAAISGRRG